MENPMEYAVKTHTPSPTKQKAVSKRVNSFDSFRVPDNTELPIHHSASMGIPSKLSLGATDSPHEHEADQMASAVTQMPKPLGQRGDISNRFQTKPSVTEKTTPLSTSVESHIHQVLRSGGQPLSKQDRAYFEPRFQQDFSHVCMHTGPQATEAAESIDARAFTLGQHIVLGRGGSDTKRHELGHVHTNIMQQQNGGYQSSAVIHRQPKTPPHVPRQTFGELTISPKSKISAQQLVDMIQKNEKLTTLMKDMFTYKGNSLVLTRDPEKINQDQFPQWFKSALLAIKKKHWHLTTALSIISEQSDLVDKKLIPDNEDGDHPKGAAFSERGILGETIPSESLVPRDSMYSRRMDDYEGVAVTPGERRLKKGHEPAEGLIVVGDRLRDTKDTGPVVKRSGSDILETLFHELSSHASLNSQHHISSEHGPVDWHTHPTNEADELAHQVYKFFNNHVPEEALVKAQGTVWSRTRWDLTHGTAWNRARWDQTIPETVWSRTRKGLKLKDPMKSDGEKQ